MELDIAAGAFLDLGEKLDNVHSAVKGLYDCKPFYGRTFGTGVVDAAGDNLRVPCDQTPSAGRVWNILQIGVWGPDPIVAVANAKCAVYVGPESLNDYQNISNMIVRIPSGQIPPTPFQFSKGVIWCRPQEQVYCWVNSAAAATPITLVAWYADYPVEAVEALSQ